MRFVHVGSVVVDLVAVVPVLPPRGGDVVASAFAPTPGGGFNVLAAVARQGMPAAYAGPHGSGPFGALVRAALAELGVTVLAEPRAVDTGLVVTLVDDGGERTFVTSPDAVVGPTAADLARVRPGPGDTVSVSGYGLLHPPSRDVLVPWALALPAGVTVVLDPGPLAPAAVLAPLLPRVDWLTANLAEAEELAARLPVDGAIGGSARDSAGPFGGRSGTDGPSPTSAVRPTADSAGPVAGGAAGGAVIAAGLARRTGCGVVVRTGASGCVVVPPGGGPVVVPGFTVRALDTTGAGDAHTGMFAVELARGRTAVAAARTANAVAALTVTRRGPATSPTGAELAGFLAALPPNEH